MTDTQKAEEASRAAFEAQFPIPLNCERCGPGYTATSYSAWPAHDHSQRWTGWQAGATWAASQSAAEVAALRTDAERYRWLRHHWLEVRAVKDGPRCESVNLICHDDAGIGDEDDGLRLDRAIDAALAATQPKEPTA